jgi:hypothetical protein
LRESGTLLPGLPRVSEAPQGPAAADWVWGQRPRAVQQANRELFAAHFVLGQEPGDPVVVEELIAKVRTDCAETHLVLSGRSSPEGGAACETIGRESAFRARLRCWLLGE